MGILLATGPPLIVGQWREQVLRIEIFAAGELDPSQKTQGLTAVQDQVAAFDPARQAILLVAGDKSGQSEAKFYRSLIATADKRFDAYLKGLRGRHGP